MQFSAIQWYFVALIGCSPVDISMQAFELWERYLHDILYFPGELTRDKRVYLDFPSAMHMIRWFSGAIALFEKLPKSSSGDEIDCSLQICFLHQISLRLPQIYFEARSTVSKILWVVPEFYPWSRSSWSSPDHWSLSLPYFLRKKFKSLKKQ